MKLTTTIGDIQVELEGTPEEILQITKDLQGNHSTSSQYTIDWDEVPAGFDWVAVDEDLEVYGFTDRPQINKYNNWWDNVKSPFEELPLAPYCSSHDWRNSLIRRPT